jgi:hypothetical protein
MDNLTIDNWLAISKWPLIFNWLLAFLITLPMCWLMPNRLRANHGGVVRAGLSFFLLMGGFLSIEAVILSLKGHGLIPESLSLFFPAMMAVMFGGLALGRKRTAAQKE